MSKINLQIVTRSTSGYYPYTFLGYMEIDEHSLSDGNGGFKRHFVYKFFNDRYVVGQYANPYSREPEVIELELLVMAPRMKHPTCLIESENKFELMVEAGFAQRDPVSVYNNDLASFLGEQLDQIYYQDDRDDVIEKLAEDLAQNSNGPLRHLLHIIGRKMFKI